MPGKLNVSIIIPTFKRAEQTRQTLSLLYKSRGWNREFVPEVIIADSTPDNSIEKIVTEFKDPAVKYVKPRIPGIATNKNTGVASASCELIIFCDSDMEVESDTLLNTLTYLRNYPLASAVTGQVIWKGGEKDGQLDRPRREDRMKDANGTLLLEAIYSRYMATYKSLFDEAGGYDEDIFNMRGEGSDLSIRYWRSGLPLAYDEKIRVHHVHDAPAAATRHIEHPERGVIRDLIQLEYKYAVTEDQKSCLAGRQAKSKKQKFVSNFSKTLHWLTEEFGEDDKNIIIQSVVSLLPYFWDNKDKIEKSRVNIPKTYDFKFLDVFSDEKLLVDCLARAKERIKEARGKVFQHE